MPSHAHVAQLRPSTNSKKLSDYGYMMGFSSTRNAFLLSRWGKLFVWRRKPVVCGGPERCAHWTGTGADERISGAIRASTIVLFLLRCSSSHAWRWQSAVPGIERLLFCYPLSGNMAEG